MGLFAGLTSLTDLSLQRNAFTTPLPADIFDPLPSDALIRISLSAIGDHAVALGTTGTGSTTTINLSETFISRDFDGDDRPIAYGAVSSNDTGVATVTRSGLMATITAQATGTTTVNIIANDGLFPGDVTRTIPVTVSDTVVNICARTTQVESAILMAIPATNDCAAVTEAQLAGIRSLDLSGTNIGSLSAGDFAGLSGLTSLNLASTMLSALPADLFAGLMRLSMLRLQGNRFTTALPVDLFDPLPDGVLIEIDLSSFDHPTVVFGTGMIEIDLSDVFISRDENGNDRAISYSSVTVTGVGSATESGGVLTITALNTGAGTVEVTADDDNDGPNPDITQTIPTRAETAVDICSRTDAVRSCDISGHSH